MEISINFKCKLDIRNGNASGKSGRTNIHILKLQCKLKWKFKWNSDSSGNLSGDSSGAANGNSCGNANRVEIHIESQVETGKIQKKKHV